MRHAPLWAVGARVYRTRILIVRLTPTALVALLATRTR